MVLLQLNGEVDGIHNSSTNLIPPGITIGDSVTAICVYDSGSTPFGTSSNTWYSNPLLYCQVSIRSYDWNYIGRTDSKISCSDNDDFTTDQLIFSGRGYGTNGFPYATDTSWQITPLYAYDDKGVMLDSAYITDLPDSFSPELSEELVGWVRTDIPLNPRWDIRYTIAPESVTFIPMPPPILSQPTYSNDTLSVIISNLVPSLAYVVESVSVLGDTNWQPIVSYTDLMNLAPQPFSVEITENKKYIRIRGQ
jgi:hypothetical protein